MRHQVLRRIAPQYKIASESQPHIPVHKRAVYKLLAGCGWPSIRCRHIGMRSGCTAGPASGQPHTQRVSSEGSIVSGWDRAGVESGWKSGAGANCVCMFIKPLGAWEGKCWGSTVTTMTTTTAWLKGVIYFTTWCPSYNGRMRGVPRAAQARGRHDPTPTAAGRSHSRCS